ncbi:hypothetical protein BSM4216_1953 [Bacillus smithii]|nr:hypothetical protein BSM4216_1953 [Bacillus smithii]
MALEKWHKFCSLIDGSLSIILAFVNLVHITFAHFIAKNGEPKNQ